MRNYDVKTMQALACAHITYICIIILAKKQIPRENKKQFKLLLFPIIIIIIINDANGKKRNAVFVPVYALHT